MKRVALGAVVVFVMMTGLSACIPAPSPPPGYLPPVIDSVSTPDPVGPGSQVSIIVQAHDDQQISGLTISAIKGGDGRTLPNTAACISALADQGGDVTHGTITVTCMVPTFANDGTWDITANVRDNPPGGTALYKGTTVHLPFTVVGGDDDTQPPKLVSYSTDPAQLHTNSVFTFTTLFSDPAGVMLRTGGVEFSKVGVGGSTMECDSKHETDISPTDVQYVWSCTATFGKTQAGEYQFNIDVIDGLGHQGTAHRGGVMVTVPPSS